MVCDLRASQSATERAQQAAALARLTAALGANQASIVIGPTGAIAFTGWSDRSGMSDLCAYRKLSAANSPELRRAIMRAEAASGRRLNPQAIGAGMHSHDGGRTWGTHSH